MNKKFNLAFIFSYLQIIIVVLGQSNQFIPNCKTPAQTDGLCQYFDTCYSLNSLLQKNPLPQQDRDYIILSKCGFVNNKHLVCCPDNVQGQGQNSPPKQELNKGLLPEAPICGGVAGDRIFGGEVTDIDEYPWAALLAYEKPNNRQNFHCGGVLISSRYVLTASHCVNGRDIPASWRLSYVRLGEHTLTTDPDCSVLENGVTDCAPGPLDIPIEEAIPHERYNLNSKKENDIALLRLSQIVEFNDFVKPICLPRRNRDYAQFAFEIVGWGKTESLSQSDVKLKATVPFVNNTQCNLKYNPEGITITNKQMCAGGRHNIDSCRGDSGGPLMAIDQVNIQVPFWYVAGVISYGPTPCGQLGWPGVYTKVISYVEWIKLKVVP